MTFKNKSVFLYTSIIGDNSLLIQQIANFYFIKDMHIADVTYGKGAFWRNVDLSMYHFYPSDIKTYKKTPYDFRKLPYKNATMDVVVLDPPYMNNPGKPMVNANYKNQETTKGLYHKDIMDLYFKGMQEAKRVLKNNGLLLIKCKDEIESSIQRLSHVELIIMANKLGYYIKDIFILTQKNNPHIQHKAQQHARKNHSYLLILESCNTTKKYKVQHNDLIKK